MALTSSKLWRAVALLAIPAALVAAPARAAGLAGTIETVAGGLSGTVPALSGNIVPMGITTDGAGTIFVADLTNDVVRRIDSAATISTAAGDDSLGAGGDGGPATSAQLYGPNGVARDGNGNLYIADSLNNRVRKVTPAGVISTLAGGATAAPASNGDGGPATSAVLSSPDRVAVDSAGDVFIADVNHSEVRKVDTSGTITTYAGKSGFSYSGDGGPATSATFAGIGGMTVMPDGSLLIADRYDGRIRRVDSSGIITTVAGNGSGQDSGDGGPATAAGVYQPADVTTDHAGGYWIAELGLGAIRHVTAAGIISTLPVSGLQRPQGVTDGGNGAVLISDLNSRRVLLQSASGTTTVVAGNGDVGYSGDGIPATEASIYAPVGIAFDSHGNYYVADEVDYRIRQVAPTGIVTTIAGSGQPPCRSSDCDPDANGDGGPALQAILASPMAVAVDGAGDVYFPEQESSRVRKIDTNGVITTFAGFATNAGSDGLGDGGPAAQAKLAAPYGITIAPDGSVIIADMYDHRVRRVASDGAIITIAGNGTGGFAGDGAAATAAELNHPTSVAYDSAGNLYIADFSNQRVRKVTPTGMISTVAGGSAGAPEGAGDGLPATAVGLTGPYGVAADAAGDLFISDQTAQRLVEVDTTGTFHNVGGTGSYGYSGDGGSATLANVWWPSGIAVGPDGGVYFADQQNHRIREIAVGPAANVAEAPLAPLLPLAGVPVVVVATRRVVGRGRARSASLRR